MAVGAVEGHRAEGRLRCRMTVEDTTAVDRDPGEIDPSGVGAPCRAGQGAATIGNAAVGRREIDPAEACRPDVAGKGGIGDGDVATIGEPIHIAAVVIPRVLIRRDYGAGGSEGE